MTLPRDRCLVRRAISPRSLGRGWIGLVVAVVMSAAAMALAASSASAYIYVAGPLTPVEFRSPATLERLSLDGAAVEPNYIVGPRVEGSNAIQVDGERIYWLDSTGGDCRLATAALDGTDVRIMAKLASAVPKEVTGDDLVQGPGCGAATIAIADGYLYTNGTDAAAIGRVSLQPPYSVEPDFIRLPQNVEGPESLVTDGSWLYWMDNVIHTETVGDWHYISATHSVGRARVDGTDVEPDLFQPEGDDGAWLLGVGQGHLWWYSRRGTGSVGRARLDGSDVERAYLKGIQVYAGALAPPWLYYTGSACNEPGCVDVDGAIRRIALEPGATPDLIARLGSGAGSAIALDSLGPQPGAASAGAVDRGKLSIKYGSGDFKGREKAVPHACEKQRRVKVLKARKHRKDRVIGRERTSRRGRYKVHAGHVKGRFYARAPKDGNCAKDRSREIGV
jgi:hypothetical protein